MRVKRYIVDSLPHAHELIKNDLGRDAVILYTKPVRKGGLFGLFGKKKFEVIAAVDQVPPSAPAGEEDPRRKGQAVSPEGEPAGGGRSTAVPAVAARAYRAASEAAKHPSASERAAPPPVSETSASDRHLREVPAAQAPDSARTARSGAPLVSASDDLAGEIRALKEMVARLMVGPARMSSLPPALQEVCQHLAEQGVSDELVARLVERLMPAAGEGASDAEAVWAEARRAIEALLAEVAPPRPTAEAQVHVFVGPTGVGKTTTLAKLAAEQVLKHRRKVAFVTADTYRIAAVDQLRTYANILNIPLEVVFSADDLRKALAKLADCDRIFLDTAGRNYRNASFVEELKTLLAPAASCATHLVLSLTTKYEDVKAIVANFLPLSIRAVIFTKADETSSYGALLNVAGEFGLPTAYVCCGQNVPDDIWPATPARIAHLLVGEKRRA
ncbi:MAG TPA: flagellar biosynthesis protein FlhF [Calditerricola sp.]